MRKRQRVIGSRNWSTDPHSSQNPPHSVPSFIFPDKMEAIGHIHQERASETVSYYQSLAGYTLESKDQENVQRAFGAIRVPLWWWCEYYGARSTFEKPGLAFVFNSGLSTPSLSVTCPASKGTVFGKCWFAGMAWPSTA
ncbi:hypothetical protein EV421DRAFT_2022852 [Armillaria borealis]|uniref:Uncharacterized protein n=1 Tax=Armillaria borealis TaxID=47425 RepID=A0AA39MI54_9AGAR|nr:hypothetical protein EV421DRAFT_2022852 [Armillaria borealis]